MKKKQWKTSEIRIILRGELPEGRTYHAVQQFCCRMGLVFPGKRYDEKNGINKNAICFQCRKKCSKENKIDDKFFCSECNEKVINARKRLYQITNAIEGTNYEKHIDD